MKLRISSRALKGAAKAALRSQVCIIRKGGLIVFPPGPSPFSLGQRVYFHNDGPNVIIAPKPKRAVRGRFFSSRIRRGIRSLAAYGPRTQS